MDSQQGKRKEVLGFFVKLSWNSPRFILKTSLKSVPKGDPQGA
jgi:hypothetical protein